MIIFHSLEIRSVSYRDDFPQAMIPMRSRREVTLIRLGVPWIFGGDTYS